MTCYLSSHVQSLAPTYAVQLLFCRWQDVLTPHQTVVRQRVKLWNSSHAHITPAPPQHAHLKYLTLRSTLSYFALLCRGLCRWWKNPSAAIMRVIIQRYSARTNIFSFLFCYTCSDERKIVGYLPGISTTPPSSASSSDNNSVAQIIKCVGRGGNEGKRVGGR